MQIKYLVDDWMIAICKIVIHASYKILTDIWTIVIFVKHWFMQIKNVW